MEARLPLLLDAILDLRAERRADYLEGKYDVCREMCHIIKKNLGVECVG